ncbi:uncharacterized protein [Montipora capricornis]|uniref:uncharacterized protein n=1 Tax=Montipora capricornis TaxID=246305 RepID=UPI0035F1E21E
MDSTEKLNSSSELFPTRKSKEGNSSKNAEGFDKTEVLTSDMCYESHGFFCDLVLHSKSNVLESKILPGVCVLIWSNHAWQATFQIVFRDCDEDFSVEYFIGFMMKKARVVIHLSFFPA